MITSGCTHYKEGALAFQFRDATTQQPITHANMTVDEANISWIYTGKFETSSFDSMATITDNKGQVRITDITLGRWVLRVDAEGYDVQETVIDLADLKDLWNQGWSEMNIKRHNAMAPEKHISFRILTGESTSGQGLDEKQSAH
jgi:hypothetical protein